eukprot:jgi/Orpsp1_1/1181445/evm.model.c7180000077235.1
MIQRNHLSVSVNQLLDNKLPILLILLVTKLNLTLIVVKRSYLLQWISLLLLDGK